MITIHITFLIVCFLLGCQTTSLIAQFTTQNKYWIIGSVGLMPIIILLIWSDKIFGGG